MTDVLYKLTGVSHFYTDKKVLDIHRLTIPTGSITGLSGPNGSGKSTLLKLLAFAMAPTRGEIRFNGRPEHPMSPRVRSRVSLLTQKPYLLKRRVLDNVLYGLKIRKDHKDLEKRAARALEAVGLPFNEFKDRHWHELSGGEAQRVAMAARLILRPKALLLDEPVASVDTRSARLIRQASLAARDAWGCTLIIVSHDLLWLNECSDTRISMSKGRLFATKEECILPINNGEHLILPPRTGTTAVILQEKVQIRLNREEKSEAYNQVSARVIQMILEQKTGNILASFSLNDFSISLSLTPDQAAGLSLQPGKDVILAFKPSDVTWR